MPTFARTLLLGAILGGVLHGETSEYPLALNLPTGDMMQFWDIGMAFTHRFDEPAPGHGKDLYGLDGYAYPAFGFDFGLKPVKGLNAIIYRTADNKTLTFGLQQRLVDSDLLRLTVRAERFDETVPRAETPLGTVGIAGASVQVPAEFFLGDRGVLTLDPAWISRTTTRTKAVVTAGAGLRFEVTGKLGVMAEYYPRPAGLGKGFRPGYSAGFTYKTTKHRFTVLATNAQGTTANQVLSGDFGGGPRSTGLWSLGFNLTRTF
jgi:opacity protein-like surface antigen